jgi:steroid delta-isomerase-like uncharacterized protein
VIVKEQPHSLIRSTFFTESELRELASNIKNAIERFIQDRNRHDLSGLSSVIAEDILYSEPFGSKPLHGIEAVKEDWQEFFVMIPDVQMKIENILVEDDRAAFELRYAGTQTGPIGGREGPPTNRCIEMTCAIFVQTNSKGLIQEWREYYDTGIFYKQLGLEPKS